MNKRFINTYIKYTAKKPVLFFAMIGIFVFFILFISLTTKTSLIQSYNGLIFGDTIVVNAELKTVPESIFVYVNRNEAVYLINIKSMEHEDNSTILFIDNNEEHGLAAAENIKIDIAVGEITLFERIFLKGGKANG
ncbi:MAG: hypothetical protein FWD23_03340 [Oscillospiraceae bacterium]|nr:hypothetical protein [Oscillospiraceae bacterium]